MYNSRKRSTSRGGYLHAGRARLTNGSIAAPERRREYGKCRTVPTKDPFQNSRFRKAPYLGIALFIAIFHVGSLWFGNVLFSRGAQVMPAFRGFAVDLAIVLVFGTRYWPILLAVFFGSSMGKGVPWLPSCGLAVACTVRTVAAAWIFRRASNIKSRLGPFEDLAGIIGAGLAPGLAACFGAVCLIAAGKFPPSEWAAIVSQWWSSDALGMLTVTPVLLAAARWWSDGKCKLLSWHSAYAFLYMAGVSVACYFIFFRTAESYLLFTVFLLILVAAAWLGPTAARVAALVIAGTAVWATHNGVGSFAGGTLSGNLQNLALFLIAVSVTGIAVGGFRAASNLALPGGVLLMGWAVSGWLYGSMDRDRKIYDGARLDEVIGSVETRINHRFQTYEKVLWGAAGFLEASGEITPKSWHIYVERLRAFEGDPGTTAMAIVQPVPDKELNNFVRTHRNSEWPAFTAHKIDSVAAAPDFFPEHLLVICAEPETVALKSIGADLATDPLRRAAAEQARDSGAAVLSRSTTLGDGSGRALQLFVPVYRVGASLKTTEERRSALVAWVSVVFRADTVFRSALGALEGVLSLKVYYGEHAAPSDQFFQSGGGQRAPRAPERTTHLTLGKNTWTLDWRRLPNFPYVSRTPTAWAAGCTALLSLLLAGLVMALQATRQRATDRLKLIESASSLGTWELDVTAKTVQCSGQLLRLYGIYEDKERLTLEEWLSYVHPDDRELVIGELMTPRGNRESIDRQYRVVWPDGSIHWLHSRALPVFGAHGEQSLVVGVDFDISEVKQLQSQLAQAQKLESVGQLAAGVAHEINTPIQYVGDNAKFLEDAFRELIGAPGKSENSHRQTQGDERELEYLRKEVPVAITQLIEGVNQVARIVRAMKEFSHPGPLDIAAVDINRAIESTILVSKHEWKFVAEVTTNLDPNLPLVPCVAGELNQVILNLIVNAAHAIADVVKDSGRLGRIRISTRQRDSVVEISVADTGTGIPDGIQSRVFDPFFTTKPVGKGTGQGLAIAHTVIVQKHKGTLRFETERGRGTTFVIELPLAHELEPA